MSRAWNSPQNIVRKTAVVARSDEMENVSYQRMYMTLVPASVRGCRIIQLSLNATIASNPTSSTAIYANNATSFAWPVLTSTGVKNPPAHPSSDTDSELNLNA